MTQTPLLLAIIFLLVVLVLYIAAIGDAANLLI